MKLFLLNRFTVVIGIISILSLESEAIFASDSVFTQQVMLKSMAENCIVPGIQELAMNTAQFSSATERLMKQPNQQALVETKAAWLQLQSVCQRQQFLFYGLIEDPISWQADFYRRSYPTLIENLIHRKQPINEDFIQRAGGPAKGMVGAEYLLFSPISVQLPQAIADGQGETNAFISWLLTGKTAERRRQYLCQIAHEINRQLQTATLKANEQKFPIRFAATGQDGVNLLVNGFVAGLETEIIIPLQNSLKKRQVTRLPGSYLDNGIDSETEVSGMQVALEGLHLFYHGAGKNGLNIYLQQVNSGLDGRLEDQFKSTDHALAALGKSLYADVATQPKDVEEALAQAHKLEILVKVDMVSAMGVTIMFNGYDGD